MRWHWDGTALLKKKPKTLAGLDIGTSGVRLVELGLGRDGERRVEHAAFEPLPQGAIADGNIDNLEQVMQAVQRLWRRSGTRTRQVALALPAAFVITKKLILPADLSEEQLELQVETEASHYISSSPEEVRLDFVVLGPAEHVAEEVAVLFAAARREKVEDRVAVVEQAALEARIMDVDTYASRAALEYLLAAGATSEGQGKTALFQIGAHLTQLTVLQDGEVLYERTQAFGGQQLTQEIVQAYDIPPDEAERRKRSGDLPHGYEAALLQPFLAHVAQEVERALQFFFNATSHSRIDRIVLAGGGALLPGMADTLRGKLGIATALANPFQGMRYSSGVREKQLRLEAPAYLTACGLALRGFAQ